MSFGAKFMRKFSFHILDFWIADEALWVQTRSCPIYWFLDLKSCPITSSPVSHHSMTIQQHHHHQYTQSSQLGVYHGLHAGPRHSNLITVITLLKGTRLLTGHLGSESTQVTTPNMVSLKPAESTGTETMQLIKQAFQWAAQILRFSNDSSHRL